jgi:hypothetical protein
MDVWMIRKAMEAKLHFWGISQMERAAALEAIAAAQSIWFLADPFKEYSAWCASRVSFRLSMCRRTVVFNCKGSISEYMAS